MPSYCIDAQEEALLALAAEQADSVMASARSELAIGAALSVPIRRKAWDGQRFLGLFSIELDALICTPPMLRWHR